MSALIARPAETLASSTAVAPPAVVVKAPRLQGHQELAPKAYSYLRFSSPEQATGASRRRQIDGAAAWARQHDMALDEQLRDEGVSAFRGQHRGSSSALGGFLKRVERGEVAAGSVLIIESFDRLSREEVVDALELFLSITRAKITIVTLIDGRVYNRQSLREDTTQLLISIIIMTRAYEESSTKSKRVAHAWSMKREAARNARQAMTATCPGWVRLIGGPRTGYYELVEERAQIVRDVFAATIAGQGRRTIAKRLNETGVEVWGVAGNKGAFWHDSYIQKILTSPAVFGRFEARGERIDAYFPAAVPEDTFWKAKAATAQRKFGAGRPAKRFTNLLHRLAKCHVCGSNMAYQDKGKRSKPFLRCSKASASAGCDSRVYAPYRDLETLTVGLYARFRDAADFASRATVGEVLAKSDIVEAKLAAARTRSGNLAVAIAEGGKMVSLRLLLETTDLEVEALERELAELKVAAAAEAMTATDPLEREAELYNYLSEGDAQLQFQRRKLFNARLCRLLDALIINEGGTGFFMKARGGIDPWDERVQETQDPRTWQEFLRDEATTSSYGTTA